MFRLPTYGKETENHCAKDFRLGHLHRIWPWTQHGYNPDWSTATERAKPLWSRDL